MTMTTKAAIDSMTIYRRACRRIVGGRSAHPRGGIGTAQFSSPYTSTLVGWATTLTELHNDSTAGTTVFSAVAGFATSNGYYAALPIGGRIM